MLGLGKVPGHRQVQVQVQGQGQGVKSKSTDEYTAGLAFWEDKFDRFKDSSRRPSTSPVSAVSAIATSKVTGHGLSQKEVSGG